MVYKGCKVTVLRGDLTKVGAAAIVNPANSLGLMGGGVAGAIRRAGGDDIETEAMKSAPLGIGKAIFTRSGGLRCFAVIHAPTMEEPAMPSSIGNIKKATKAALDLANGKKINSIAFPGMGTGVGRVDKLDAAKAMVETIKESIDRGTSLKEIILVDRD